MQITGDVVAEWIKKTHEIFGRPRKTIVFCAGVDHGIDLSRKFAEQGYNFISISYRDDGDFKKEVIEDFAKPDTEIHGLIATDILTKGFDVPDVMIGVSARPFSKSLSSHIQQMGRVMRSNASNPDDKPFALWLDHSGNYLRFRKDWDKLFDEGVTTLPEGGETAKKEPTEREKKESKCPKCGGLWPKGSDTCSYCGHVKVRLSQIQSVPGELFEVSGAKKGTDNREFYRQLLCYSKSRNYKDGWAAHKYKEKFGVFPRGLSNVPKDPSRPTLNWIKSRAIAFAKGKSRRVV